MPFQGAAPAMQSVLGGQTPIFHMVLPVVAPHIRSGAIRPLAVAAVKRYGDSSRTFRPSGRPASRATRSASGWVPMRSPGHPRRCWTCCRRRSRRSWRCQTSKSGLRPWASSDHQHARATGGAHAGRNRQMVEDGPPGQSQDRVIDGRRRSRVAHEIRACADCRRRSGRHDARPRRWRRCGIRCMLVERNAGDHAPSQDGHHQRRAWSCSGGSAWSMRCAPSPCPRRTISTSPGSPRSAAASCIASAIPASPNGGEVIRERNDGTHAARGRRCGSAR